MTAPIFCPILIRCLSAYLVVGWKTITCRSGMPEVVDSHGSTARWCTSSSSGCANSSSARRLPLAQEVDKVGNDRLHFCLTGRVRLVRVIQDLQINLPIPKIDHSDPYLMNAQACIEATVRAGHRDQCHERVVKRLSVFHRRSGLERRRGPRDQRVGGSGRGELLFKGTAALQDFVHQATSSSRRDPGSRLQGDGRHRRQQQAMARVHDGRRNWHASDRYSLCSIDYSVRRFDVFG